MRTRTARAALGFAAGFAATLAALAGLTWAEYRRQVLKRRGWR